MKHIIQTLEPKVRLIPLFIIILAIACCADFVFHHGLPAVVSIVETFIGLISQVVKP
jgi:hypothetical protein